MDYKDCEHWLDLLNEPARTGCKRLLSDNLELFKTVQGSTHNHQNWKGGYLDHIEEVLNIAALLYPVMDAKRMLPFELKDALLVLYLHDVEKPWKFQLAENGELEVIPDLRDKEAQHRFRSAKLKEYGITLTEEQKNALRYVEGELSEYSSTHRVANQLAGFCHMCDHASARVWSNYPFERHDMWKHRPTQTSSPTI